MPAKQETWGAVLALISAALWGIFPVMVNRGSHDISPLAFAAVSTLLAALGSCIYMVSKGNLSELKRKEAYPSLLMVTLCIVIIPYVLLFIGSSMTSGLNTSMLLLSEIIFTLIFTPLIGEKTSVEKLMGALGVFAGAVLILYNKKFQFNMGDAMVIASTATYPIGNFYSKKALNLVSPSVILFVRFLFGGLFILALSIIVGGQSDISDIVRIHWRMLLLTGLILLGIGKVVWYEALSRLDISKAISLSMTFPLFSLLVLMGVFDESVSTRQWIGILVMMLGVFFSVRRSSVDPALTRYAP